MVKLDWPKTKDLAHFKTLFLENENLRIFVRSFISDSEDEEEDRTLESPDNVETLDQIPIGASSVAFQKDILATNQQTLRKWRLCWLMLGLMHSGC